MRVVPGLLALALLVTVACGPASPPPWLDSLDYRAEEVFAVTSGHHGFPLLEATLDGHAVQLAFDTGNMTGLLLAAELADAWALPQGSGSTHRRSDGSVAGRLRTFRVGRLEALGRSWPDQVAHEDRRAEGDGYIGPRYVAGGRFTLDLARGHLALTARALPAPGPDGVRLELVRSSRHPHMVVVRGKVNDLPVLVQLDTCKSRTCVDPELVSELWLPSGADGVRLDRIELGPLSFAVPAAKPVGFAGISRGLPGPIRVGLGVDLLASLVLTVDYAGGTVLLQR